MQRSVFYQMVGELVSSNDSEECFICLGCGKPKLYKNIVSGRYICHVCGYAGQAETNEDRPIYIPSSQRHMPACAPIYREFSHPSLASPPNMGRLQGRITHDNAKELGFCGSGVKMFLQNTLCGFHSYNPNNPYRYITEGKRGVVTYENKDGDSVYRKYTPSGEIIDNQVFLFEGLFDWATAATRVHGTSIFLAGNTCTPAQIDELFCCTTPEDIIHVCFDSDKPGFAARLALTLSSIRNVRMTLPPEGYKDWDEAIQVGYALGLGD